MQCNRRLSTRGREEVGELRHDLLPVGDQPDVGMARTRVRPGSSLTASTVPAARTPIMWLSLPEIATAT